MNETIYEKAKELGRLLGQTQEYQALGRARTGAGEDRELVKRLNRLGEMEAEVAQSLERGEEPPQALQAEYEALISEVQSRPAYQALVAGQANLERIMHRVNEEIARGMEAASKSRIILPS